MTTILEYAADRLKEAGTYRSMIWALVSATPIAAYMDADGFMAVLGGIGVVLAAVSAMMKEKSTTTVNTTTVHADVAMTNPSVATVATVSKETN